jgi:hypothetical protein
MATKFIPRAVFPAQDSLPRSYFLGHHAAGLAKMKTLLSSIDLIIECRDYRVPLTSRNPLFEQSLAGRERLVVYTKRDLGSKDKPADKKVREAWAKTSCKHPHSILISPARRYHPILAQPSLRPVLRLQKETRCQYGPQLRQGLCSANHLTDWDPNAHSRHA